MLVGTAFDYLLRFELQRRAPHSRSEHWVADYAPDMIWRKTDSGGAGIDLLLMKGVDPEHYMPPDEVAERMQTMLKSAKEAVAAYVKQKSPTPALQAALASYAIRLAKLDAVYRAKQLEPGFEDVNSEDTQDLVDLLAIVPFDELLHDELVLLNPTFRQASFLVGRGILI